MTFKQKSSLVKHARTHTGEKPYVCTFLGCTDSFTQVSNLIRHKRIHGGPRPHVCSVCGKDFISSTNLKQHALIHESKERQGYECGIKGCSSSYLYLCSLKKHLKASHKDVFEKLEAKTDVSGSFYIRLQQFKNIKEVNSLSPSSCLQTNQSEEIPNLLKTAEKAENNVPVVKVNPHKITTFNFKNRDSKCIRHIKGDANLDIEDGILVSSGVKEENLSKIENLSSKCQVVCSHHKSCPAMEVVFCKLYVEHKCNCLNYCKYKFALYSKYSSEHKKNT